MRAQIVASFVQTLDTALREEVACIALAISIYGGAYVNHHLRRNNPLTLARQRARLPIDEVAVALGVNSSHVTALEILCDKLSSRELLAATALINQHAARWRAAKRASTQGSSGRHLSARILP